MRVLWYMNDLHACGAVRGEALARAVNGEFAGTELICKGETCLSDMWWADVMVFQRQDSAGVLEFMRSAQRRGIVCVWEIDDDLWAVPEMFPDSCYSDPAVMAVVDAFAREADAVTVSTRALAEAVAERAPEQRVFVLRNGLDLEAWRRADAERAVRVAADAEEVTIGWMASRSHQIDAPLVAPALWRVLEECPEARLLTVGWIGPEQLGGVPAELEDRVRCEKWVGIGALPAAMAEMDIGLAPLMGESRYNLSKSGVKLLQYWALGMAVVASPVPNHKELMGDGVTGLLAEDEDGWYRALVMLVRNRALRERMGACGRLELLRHWDMRRMAAAWVRLWKDLRSGGGRTMEVRDGDSSVSATA